MKRSFLIGLAFAITLSQCESDSTAQNECSGGYVTIDPNRREVIAPALFAVAQLNNSGVLKYKFNKVLSAEKQVVKGANYKLEVSVTRIDDQEYALLFATVYEDLSSKMHVITYYIVAPNRRKLLEY